MKVSVLTPNFSTNCLGRSYLLAQIIKRHFDVEIVGPVYRQGIWPPLLSQTDIDFKPIPWSNYFPTHLLYQKIKTKIEGKIIYSSKPLNTSFGIGLSLKKRLKIPLVLDIDDWELGIIKNVIKRFPRGTSSAFLNCITLGTSSSPIYIWRTEEMLKKERKNFEITVSNTFLKSRYDGTIIWHSRDENIFNPKRFNSEVIRQKYNLPLDTKVVMFLGTPQPYKGLEELIISVSNHKDLCNSNFILVVGGLGKDNYSEYIKRFGNQRLGKKFFPFGHIPFSEIPKFISMADVMVVPQLKLEMPIGQLPAKLFDAMAMGRSIISTAASDIPYVLGDTGLMINPSRDSVIKEFGSNISYLLENEEVANELGQRARNRFVKYFSFGAMQDKVRDIVEKAYYL